MIHFTLGILEQKNTFFCKNLWTKSIPKTNLDQITKKYILGTEKNHLVNARSWALNLGAAGADKQPQIASMWNPDWRAGYHSALRNNRHFLTDPDQAGEKCRIKIFLTRKLSDRLIRTIILCWIFYTWFFFLYKAWSLMLSGRKA